jgi:hypothetical protein
VDRRATAVHLTPDDLIERFLEAARRFEGLRPFFPDSPEGSRQRFFHIECSARLNQARYALNQFREFERPPASHPDVELMWKGSQFEHLRFYADAFYYFAWRFHKLVRRLEIGRGGKTLQPFKTLDCRGINTARNRLIEHGEKSDGMIVNTFTVDCKEGFVMQPFHSDGAGRLDKGLYPNAIHLVDEIERRLSELVV